MNVCCRWNHCNRDVLARERAARMIFSEVKPELLADQTGFGKTAHAIFSDAEVRRDNARNTFV
jgi:hypothetical protein